MAGKIIHKNREIKGTAKRGVSPRLKIWLWPW
jgi:hypothetical protein